MAGSEKRWAPAFPPLVLAATAVALSLQVVMTLAYIAALAVGDVPRPLDFNAEGNLTTWWSSTLMLVAAALAGFLFLCERRLGRRSAILALLAAGLVGLSIEEVAALHETIGHYADVAPHVADWTLVYLPVLAVGAFIVLKVVLTLPRPFSIVLAAGLVAYAVGLGLEASLILSDEKLATSGQWEEAARVLMEENSELLGSTLVAAALGARLHQRLPLVVTGPPGAHQGTQGSSPTREGQDRLGAP